eukprot:1158572-Pelagomonas_calceolata.AAC.1
MLLGHAPMKTVKVNSCVQHTSVCYTELQKCAATLRLVTARPSQALIANKNRNMSNGGHGYANSRIRMTIHMFLALKLCAWLQADSGLLIEGRTHTSFLLEGAMKGGRDELMELMHQVSGTVRTCFLPGIEEKGEGGVWAQGACQAPALLCTHAHTRTHTRSHAHTYVRTHAHTHTHARTHARTVCGPEVPANPLVVGYYKPGTHARATVCRWCMGPRCLPSPGATLPCAQPSCATWQATSAPSEASSFLQSAVLRYQACVPSVKSAVSLVCSHLVFLGRLYTCSFCGQQLPRVCSHLALLADCVCPLGNVSSFLWSAILHNLAGNRLNIVVLHGYPMGAALGVQGVAQDGVKNGRRLQDWMRGYHLASNGVAVMNIYALLIIAVDHRPLAETCHEQWEHAVCVRVCVRACMLAHVLPSNKQQPTS